MLNFRFLLWFSSVLMAFGQDKVTWYPFGDAMALANKNGKKVLVYIYVKWSPLCILMEQKVFSNPNIANYLNKMYFPVKIHAESKDTIWYQNIPFVYNDSLHANELVGLLMNEVAYPGTVILTGEGQILGAVSGYLDPKTFQSLLYYFAESHYKIMEWEQYLQVSSGTNQ